MTKELTQIERAVRFAILIRSVPPEQSLVYLHTEDLLDAKAIGQEFQRLFEKELNQIEAGRKHGHLGASHGHKGGRPKLKNPSTSTLAKRKSRAKKTMT